MNLRLAHRSLIVLRPLDPWRVLWQGNGASGRTPGEEHDIFTRSGRLALWVGLRALQLPEGARIGVQPFLPYEVFEMIRHAGYQPRFVDMNRATLNLSLKDLTRKKNELDALLVAFTFGNPLPVAQVRRVVGRSLPVIVDLAHSLPTPRVLRAVRGADMAFFSFRFGKLLSALEGGLLKVLKPRYLERAREAADQLQRMTKPGRGHAFLQALSLSARCLAVQRPLYGLFSSPVKQAVGDSVDLARENRLEFGPVRALDQLLMNRYLSTDPLAMPAIHHLFRRHAFAANLVDHWRPEGIQVPRFFKLAEHHFFKLPLLFQDEGTRRAFRRALYRVGIDASTMWHKCISDAYQRYGYTGDCPVAEWVVPRLLAVSLHRDWMLLKFVQVLRAFLHLPSPGAAQQWQAELAVPRSIER